MESSQPEGLVMKEKVQKNDTLDLPKLESKLLYNGDIKNSSENCDESGPSNDRDSLLSKENSPPQLSPISPAVNNTADNSENGADTFAGEMSLTMSIDKSENQEGNKLKADVQSEPKSSCVSTQKADNDSDKGRGDDGHINKPDLKLSNAEHVPDETFLGTVKTCNNVCIDDSMKLVKEAKNYTTFDKEVILKPPVVDEDLGCTVVPAKTKEIVKNADEDIHVSNVDVTPKDLKADKNVTDLKNEKGSTDLAASDSVTDKSHTIPPQMFEDITDDEDSENEESFENIELELDDLIDPADLSKIGEKEKAELVKGLEVNKNAVDLNTKGFQPKDSAEDSANPQGDNSVGFVKSLSISPNQSIIEANVISETPRSANTVIQGKSEKSSHEGNIYTILHSSDSKAVNGLTDGVHIKKPKVTARKSGRPESAPLKINLHPIKNITMTISDVEKALDYPSRDADGFKLSKITDTVSKTNNVNTESSQSDGSSGFSALKALAGLKKKRRKNTYDFPGCKKKQKKFKSDELESVGSSADSFSLSDGDFPDTDINKEAAPVDQETNDKTTINKTESALDILTKNAYLGFAKKPKSSTSPSSSSTTLSTSKATIGKSNKMKTVLEMLHERSRQKAESDEKSVTTTVSVTTSATTTTTTILVSPPPNKPILEGVKRKGTPRKRREEVICLSDSEDSGEKKNSLEGKRKKDSIDSITKTPSSTSSIQTYSTQNKSKLSPGTTQAPVVMVVAQHSVAPGLRSLLPRHAFVQAGAASSGKVLHPPPGSVLGTFPLISTLPVGAKAISLGNLPPGMTALPITSLPQGTTQTMTFFAPVPSVGTSVSSIPVSFPGASLIVTTQKQKNSTSLAKTIKSTPGSSPLVSPTSSPAKSSKSSEASPGHGNSDSLRALLVGKPYTFTRVTTTAASQLSQAPVLFQMVTSSGTSLVPITAQPLTLTSSTGATKMLKPKSAAPGVKSSYSVIKSHPSNVPNGVSCLTPPKTPDTDGASEVAVAASLSRPVAGQVEDSEVIPLCCCKINGASFNKLFAGVTYCQALDTVDNKVLGCCNKVTNSQLVRPGVKIPFMAVCEIHRKRLKLHQCCPGCGHFCSQGKFQQCRKEGKSSVHNFHKQCMFYRGGKHYCPHCGEETSQCEVELKLNEQKPEEGKAVLQRTTKRETDRKTARISSKNFVKSRSTNEKPAEMKIALSNNKTINFGALALGPDHQSLTKLCRCTGEDRPKKYRTLPKDLYTPAMEGDLEKVFYLLLDGVDPNKRYEENDGQTAMHAAAISGSLGTVFILEQFGAEIHAQDKTLRTPMMCAAENGNLSVVQFLIKSGAKVEDRGEDGMTSLHYAAKAGYIDIIQHLLETGQLDINIQDDGGWTPIIWATESQLADVVRYLIKQGGDPNKKDNEENTGLHWAAFSGSLEIAEMFIDLGSEIDAINEHGDRPLHIAARQDHYDIVVLLLARGADVDTRNNKDETPVDCCVNKTGQVWMALKVNQQLRSFAARKLIQPERLVERDITMGREKNPIACVNSEDNELCPTDYLYVIENVETSPLNINYVITSLQSCRCKDDCSSMYCVCGRSSIKCWYDKMGRLLEEVNLLEPPLLFECNRACRCWVNCNNRVVQNGITCRLQMFRTNGRGWGVRTLMDIPKGTFVCEYIGELISDSEADRREDDSYLFDLDNKDGDTYCIDARKYGNISRFINHLCEPNLIPVKVFVEHQDLRFPRICLFSSKEIKAYEELGFDYGEKFWMIKWKHFTCACKSLKCKYSSETIKKTLADYKLRYPDQLVDV